MSSGTQCDSALTGGGVPALAEVGDPLFVGAPDLTAAGTDPAAQEQQFGYNCDYLDVLPDRERAETGRPITEASTLWPARQPARALPAV